MGLILTVLIGVSVHAIITIFNYIDATMIVEIELLKTLVSWLNDEVIEIVIVKGEMEYSVYFNIMCL